MQIFLLNKKILAHQLPSEYSMYTLKIKGTVPKNKKIEFKQSLSYLVKQLPQKWYRSHISNDIIQDDIYYFDSKWKSKEELEEFMGSNNYKILIGTFKVLGIDYQITIDEIIDS